MLEIDTSKMFNEMMNSDEMKSLADSKSKELNTSNEEDIKEFYDEEVLEDTLSKDFSKTIIERGENYYYNDNVEHVYKNGNMYYASVKGSSSVNYDVNIIVDDEDNAHYECSCPCDFNCKHEYAVILAISNQEYTEKELKPVIKEKELDLKAVIKMIPAEELKKYVLSLNGSNSLVINEENITNQFRKYAPKQKYEFYYNNLYNVLVLESWEKNRLIEDYVDRARQYLKNNEFEESFKIIKSIIEAYHDTEMINIDDDLFEAISKIGVILRISYRKANEITKNNIYQWANKLERENYYENYYLEDLILSIK